MYRKMNWRSALFIISAFSSIRYSCNAAILVTFDRQWTVDSHHWVDRWNNGSTGDLKAEEFDSVDKRMLCDTIMNAKQFTPIQNKKYYERRKTSKLTSSDITTSHEPHGSFCGGPERSLPKRQSCLISSSVGVERTINCWPCVDTTKKEWFLSPDPNDQSIYVLERNLDKDKSDFRLTGIYEQAAMVHRNKSLSKHFFTQFKTLRDKMESVCELSLDDRLRACGTISDALTTDIVQINYVIDRRCIIRNISPEVRPPGRILRCSVAVDGGTENFYALLDPRDRGALFVLVQDESGQLVPTARLTGVGAFLNPVRPRKGEGLEKRATKRKKTETVEERISVGAITESKKRSLKGVAKKRKPSERGSGKRGEESSDNSSTRESRKKLVIEINSLAREALLIYDEEPKEYKAKRTPRKRSGRMSVAELEKRLREIWRTYNSKYRNLTMAKVKINS